MFKCNPKSVLNKNSCNGDLYSKSFFFDLSLYDSKTNKHLCKISSYGSDISSKTFSLTENKKIHSFPFGRDVYFDSKNVYIIDYQNNFYMYDVYIIPNFNTLILTSCIFSCISTIILFKH